MLSINMRIFKTVLLIFALGSQVLCLPVANKSSTVTPETPTTSITPVSQSAPPGDYYDQRQNGTENYRVFVDGVVFVVAPVEALLLAGATGTDSNLSILGQNGMDISKPTFVDKPKPEVDDILKPHPAPKSAHRPGLRLANFIVPLLRRIRNE